MKMGTKLKFRVIIEDRGQKMIYLLVADNGATFFDESNSLQDLLKKLESSCVNIVKIADENYKVVWERK